MKLLKVEENNDLVRSVESGAILSVDKEALVLHRRRRSIINEQEKRIETLETRMKTLEVLLNNILEEGK